jgi:hypothetical protein
VGYDWNNFVGPGARKRRLMESFSEQIGGGLARGLTGIGKRRFEANEAQKERDAAEAARIAAEERKAQAEFDKAAAEKSGKGLFTQGIAEGKQAEDKWALLGEAGLRQQVKQPILDFPTQEATVYDPMTAPQNATQPMSEAARTVGNTWAPPDFEASTRQARTVELPTEGPPTLRMGNRWEAVAPSERPAGTQVTQTAGEPMKVTQYQDRPYQTTNAAANALRAETAAGKAPAEIELLNARAASEPERAAAAVRQSQASMWRASTEATNRPVEAGAKVTSSEAAMINALSRRERDQIYVRTFGSNGKNITSEQQALLVIEGVADALDRGQQARETEQQELLERGRTSEATQTDMMESRNSYATLLSVLRGSPLAAQAMDQLRTAGNLPPMSEATAPLYLSAVRARLAELPPDTGAQAGPAVGGTTVYANRERRTPGQPEGVTPTPAAKPKMTSAQYKARLDPAMPPDKRAQAEAAADAIGGDPAKAQTWVNTYRQWIK